MRVFGVFLRFWDFCPTLKQPQTPWLNRPTHRYDLRRLPVSCLSSSSKANARPIALHAPLRSAVLVTYRPPIGVIEWKSKKISKSQKIYKNHSLSLIQQGFHPFEVISKNLKNLKQSQTASNSLKQPQTISNNLKHKKAGVFFPAPRHSITQCGVGYAISFIVSDSLPSLPYSGNSDNTPFWIKRSIVSPIALDGFCCSLNSFTPAKRVLMRLR